MFNRLLFRGFNSNNFKYSPNRFYYIRKTLFYDAIHIACINTKYCTRATNKVEVTQGQRVWVQTFKFFMRLNIQYGQQHIFIVVQVENISKLNMPKLAC